jgi:hypothetical protein
MPMASTINTLLVNIFWSSRTKNNSYPFQIPAADRDRTVSRRSEPNSRTFFTSEQLDPWNLLQIQDKMSRHRGIKPWHQ